MADKSKPGDGLRSLKSTSLFRAINFELYVKPNLIVMAIGTTVMIGCLAYIGYMKHTYEGQGYYVAVTEDGTEQFMKKRSKWD